MMALQELTSLQVVSPVNLSAMRASAQARQMTATSGRKCAESLEKLDPLGCLLKMLMDSSVWRSPVGNLSWKTKQLYAKKRKWSSKQSGKTLKQSGINPSQLLYQLAVSVPRTDDTGYSFWGTPSAADSKGTNGGGQSRSLRTDIEKWKKGLWPTPRAVYGEHPGIKDVSHLAGTVQMWPTPHANCHTGAGEKGDGSPNLQTAVKLWPTPKASDAEMGMTARTSGRPIEKSTHLQTQVHLHTKLWPTPRASDGEKGGPNQRDSKWTYALPGAVHHTKLWPTPTAQDTKNSTLPPSQLNRDTIPGAVMREGQRGQLNPEWVEALMNFPIGWTDGE